MNKLEQKIVKTEIKKHIAMVTIDRPEKLNAIDDIVLDELENTFDKLEKNPEVHVVIITGGGDKAFVAGGDIETMRNLSLLEGEKFVYRGQKVLKKIEDSEKVVIAAINGFALGGGTELALACDIRIASDKSQLGLPEVCIGLYPGWGGTQRLVRLTGKGIAKELVFTGNRISAEEARNLKIVNKVVKHEDLLKRTEEMAQKIVANSIIAVRQAKKAINQGSEIPLESALTLEAEAWLVNFATKDRVEGLTAFLEKRKPKFQQK